MLNEILTSVNWIDIMMLCVMIRGLYVGAMQGAISELFKATGLFFSIFIASHYYTRVAEFLHEGLFIPLDLAHPWAFGALWIIVALIFRVVRDGWMIILKTDNKSAVGQCLGAVIGLLRSILICGLLFFLALLIPNQYLSRNVDHSVLGFYLLDLSPQVYKATFDKMISKLFPEEKENNKVFKVIEKHRKSQPAP